MCGVIFCVFSFSAVALDLKTNDGRVYRDLKVIIPEPDGLSVIAESGEKIKIDYDNLPDDVRKKYHFDPKKVNEYLERREREKRRERERLEKIRKRWLARYRHIREKGEPHVVIKKITLAPKGGGFIYLKERSVVPVFHEKLAVQNEIFSAPMERLASLTAYLGDLRATINSLQESIRSYPGRLKALNDELQQVHLKLATLMQTAKTYHQQVVVDENGTAVGGRPVVQYDPAVASQITDFKRRIRDLRGQISDLEKNGVETMNKQLRECQERYDEVRRNAAPFIKEETVATAKRPQSTDMDEADLKRKLSLLKTMLDEGLLSQDEYDQKRSLLLAPKAK